MAVFGEFRNARSVPLADLRLFPPAAVNSLTEISVATFVSRLCGLAQGGLHPNRHSMTDAAHVKLPDRWGVNDSANKVSFRKSKVYYTNHNQYLALTSYSIYLHGSRRPFHYQ